MIIHHNRRSSDTGPSSQERTGINIHSAVFRAGTEAAKGVGRRRSPERMALEDRSRIERSTPEWKEIRERILRNRIAEDDFYREKAICKVCGKKAEHYYRGRGLKSGEMYCKKHFDLATSIPYVARKRYELEREIELRLKEI